MASIKTPASGGSPDALHPPEAPGNPDRALRTQIEDKKRRLRELRDNYPCVRIIVDHIRKHYRTSKPPPWLDLGIVAEQLQRSTQFQSAHAAWVGLRMSLANVKAWMGNHMSWENAAVSRMPYLGTSSEIIAVEFLHSKGPGLPKGMITQLLGETNLDFLLDWNRPNHERIPEFWKGAELESPQWRRQFMEKRPVFPGLPFDDDLTDLVLSTVCCGRKSDRRGRRHSSSRYPQEIADEDGEDKSNASGARAGMSTTKRRAQMENLTPAECDGELWENQVQATMSRIVETFNEAIAAEKSRLLGKRRKMGDTAAHNGNKRQRTTEEDASQRPISSIEDSDDSSAFSALSARLAKTEGECRTLTIKYKNLKQQDRKLLAAYSRLEEDTEKLQKQIEQLGTRCQELLAESERRDEQYRCLDERCSALEERNKQLEDDNRGLQERTATVAARTNPLKQEDAHRPQAGTGPPTAGAGQADGLSPSDAGNLPRSLPMTRDSNIITATTASASAPTPASATTLASAHTAATLLVPARPTSPVIPSPANHPLVRSYLSWLPPHHRSQLIPHLANLDPQVWRLSDEEVVEYCQVNGVRYGRLHEVVVCFRRVLERLEFGPC